MLYNHDLKPVCASDTVTLSHTNFYQGRA
jgi:hypothetical protein